MASIMPSKTPGREALEERRIIARAMTSKFIDVDEATVEGTHVPDAALVQDALDKASKQLGGLMSWNVRKKLAWFLDGLDLGEVPILLRGDSPNQVSTNLGRELVELIKAAVDENAVPISWMDRAPLDLPRIQQAQRFYDAARYLSTHFQGAARVKYGSATLGNFDEVIRLYWQQLKAGRWGDKLKAGLNPWMWLMILVGSLANVPIESFTLEKGEVTEARATGHGLGLGNLAVGSAAVYGLLGLMATTGPLGTAALGLAALIIGGSAIAGPFLPLASLKKGQNKPAHELVHAMQFIVLGLALKRGIIEEEADLLAIQNKISVLGYLWGDKTEKEGTIPAEEEGKLDAMFATLKGNAHAFFAKHYKDRPEVAERRGLLFDEFVDSIATELWKQFPDLFASQPPGP